MIKIEGKVRGGPEGLLKLDGGGSKGERGNTQLHELRVVVRDRAFIDTTISCTGGLGRDCLRSVLLYGASKSGKPAVF